MKEEVSAIHMLIIKQFGSLKRFCDVNKLSYTTFSRLIRGQRKFTLDLVYTFIELLGYKEVHDILFHKYMHNQTTTTV